MVRKLENLKEIDIWEWKLNGGNKNEGKSGSCRIPRQVESLEWLFIESFQSGITSGLAGARRRFEPSGGRRDEEKEEEEEEEEMKEEEMEKKKPWIGETRVAPWMCFTFEIIDFSLPTRVHARSYNLRSTF